MNLTELKKAVATETGLKQADADKAVRAFFDTITKQLGEGNSVTLVGFGSFSVSNRAARMARNPRTGNEMQIPASKVVQFRSGKGLKDAVNPPPPAAPAKAAPAKAVAPAKAAPAKSAAPAKAAPVKKK